MESGILAQVEEKMKRNVDFKKRRIAVGRIGATVIFLEALIRNEEIDDFVIKPLLTLPEFRAAQNVGEIRMLLTAGKVYTLEQEDVKDRESAISALLRGCALIFLDGDTGGYAFEAQTANVRPVGTPVDENARFGGKESFVENVKLNTATLRKRLRTPDLAAEDFTVGVQSGTHIVLCYLANTADPELVRTVRKRIISINVDMIASMGSVEEAVLGEDYDPFPGTVNTERPDRFAAALNEGHIGLLIEGFPYGMILPATILQQMNAPEDYAQHPVTASLLRGLRWAMMGITLMAPGIYIAVMNFHQEMIPSRLLLSVNKAKAEVPFNEFTETVIMLIAFDIILEAGVRMPQNIGQAVSIVGGLIVGDAAISAKVVSPVVVIVVALTVMASFTVPGNSLVRAVKLWRFLFLLAANLLGIAGVTVGLILFIIRLTGKSVLGVPYLAPLAEEHMITKDTLVRMPFRDNLRRPEYLRNRNAVRRR